VYNVSARERMLARIRERQGKPAAPDAQELASVRGYLAQHPRSPAPRDEWEPLKRFRERALSLASTVDEAASFADAPQRVAAYLRERALPMRAVCWRELVELDWMGSGIEVESRGARGDDLVGITGACCAVAETGTLVVLSGPETPPSVSLLPETHIALVRCSSVLRNMEDAWAWIRSREETLPRAVSFISGPSRTADIEQTVTLGAHGPYRVHIVLIAD
jgi:L-lactate dehydrogenase complex protein LldG